MLKYAVILGFVSVAGVCGLVRAQAQEQPACPADAQRRNAAVRFARALNTAEVRFSSQAKRYGSISELAVGAAPDGYQAQLSSDGTSYAFSIKDTIDVCHFAMFSDQEGLIYAARPMQ